VNRNIVGLIAVVMMCVATNSFAYGCLEYKGVVCRKGANTCSCTDFLQQDEDKEVVCKQECEAHYF
jgi:hypothetical protein